MNVKKFLKQASEQAEQSVLDESDEIFLQKQLAIVRENAQAEKRSIAYRRKKMLVSVMSGIASAAACICIIAVSVSSLNKEPNILYRDDKIVSSLVTIEDLNAGMNSFSCFPSENSETEIYLFYDSVTSDNLYYDVNISGQQNVDLIFHVNKRYNYQFLMHGEIETRELEQYTVSYVVNENTDDIFPVIEYRAKIEIGNEKAYIVYTQQVWEVEQDFFEIVQSLVKVK